MQQSLLFVTTLIISLFLRFNFADEFNFRNIFSKSIKDSQDENILNQLEQRFPKFLDLNIPSNENVDKVFSKFKDAVGLIPPSIKKDAILDSNTAVALFPALQPIYRYVKDSVWKSILKLIDLPKQLYDTPARNLAETNLNNLLSYSDDETVSKVLTINSNRQDFTDGQKSILVGSYIDRIKSKLNPNNFQELITQKLGAAFLRYLPLNFLLKDQIFNDNSVLRNAASWLHLLNPTQRDGLSNKLYRTLTDTAGKIIQGNSPSSLTGNDPNTLDMIARMMPSLSTKQIINVVGDKIAPLLERTAVQNEQSCTTSLALLNRTLEEKRRSNRYFPLNSQMVERWQECYSGCDLQDLLSNRDDRKELLKKHPSPENCDGLINQVKNDYELERGVTANKLHDVSDALGSIYRADELSNLSNELMTELGRDEKALEKLGAQDLTPNQARVIISKIPRSTQNLWGKNLLGKLGNLIPGLDNAMLKQILTRGRGDLPSLFNSTAAPFIRKLIPSKIRLLIDQYATEPNLAKYRQLLTSDYAKKFIKSETLMKILQLAPDALRLVRFTPAQATTAIANRLGSNVGFDGSLSNLGMISNFVNGLTKNDIGKIKPEESLQAIQQIFGSSKSRNIDNQMQSNSRFAFGDVLRSGLKKSEASDKVDDYIKGLFREDNLVDDINPQLFTTMTNDELDAINRLKPDEANRFWNSVGLINEPTCCSFVSENRFRLADYALKHYGSATGDIDNSKLSQLGPFLATSLRASDLRRITTDALINKIQFFKSNCFQPTKDEAQALGSKLNDALSEVDDNLKALYLDLMGELAAYLPRDVNVPKKILSQRTNFLSKSLDKLRNRDEKCKIPDKDGFLSKATHGIKQTLVNAFLNQFLRQRRESNQEKQNLTCQDLRKMGSAISGLSADQISSINDEQIFQCAGTLGAVKDYDPDRLKQIAQKYIQALQNQGRHIQSLTTSELYQLGSLLTGFSPSELFQLRNEPFNGGNFLSFIGNLDGWTGEQLKSLAQHALNREQRLTPSLLGNAGKILCSVDDKLLQNIPAEEVKSYLSILGNVECPTDGSTNYSSSMFDIVKNVYKNDVFRPDIFGSLGTIASGLKSTDLGSLSPELFNFFPQQALSHLPQTIFKSFTNEQLQNLNIEQIKSIPSGLLNSLSGKQMSILTQVLYPFKSSGATGKQTFSMVFLWILPLISIGYLR